MNSAEPTASRNFGPLNPETFFKVQKRNRRATWRMSALCAFAAFIMGIPLTLVLTPLLYTIAMVVLETVNHFSPQPELLQQANDLARLGLRVADFVINQKGTLDPGELATGLALVLLPGMAVAFGLWFTMLALFRRGGVGGALASMNAREPNQSDLKELQLADVAQSPPDCPRRASCWWIRRARTPLPWARHPPTRALCSLAACSTILTETRCRHCWRTWWVQSATATWASPSP